MRFAMLFWARLTELWRSERPEDAQPSGHARGSFQLGQLGQLVLKIG